MNTGSKQVFGLIELDGVRGIYVGKIIGFPHIEFEGHVIGEVERKLREAVIRMIENQSLVLETEFAAVICLGGGAQSVVDLPP